MSNIYIQEPPTSGKVLLQTTVGDIDIELWSKEAPKACRNFVQLCLEGYYDGTVFHRVVKGFIVQGGDPEGTGFGGESIYERNFKNEIHSRLRFVRRGLVAMANSGKEDNGSQFFFTLGPCPELQNKHTIFGKVTGNTLYNMLKLEESLVDTDDRPVCPHKILSCKILDNPFEDIIPRVFQQKEKLIIEEKGQEKGTKNYSLLSFGEEAEEDEAEVDAVVKNFRGKSKSSHDLAKDPALSSLPAVTAADTASCLPASTVLLDHVQKKLKRNSGENGTLHPCATKDESNSAAVVAGSTSDVDLRRKEIQKEIKQLKGELGYKKHHKEKTAAEDSAQNVGDEKKENPLFAQYSLQIMSYREKKCQIAQKGDEREKQTLGMLAKFQNKLLAVKETDVSDEKHSLKDMESVLDDDEWLSHKLYFEDENVIAKDVNLPSADRYDITDPRNPINQRRRHAGQEKSRNWR